MLSVASNQHQAITNINKTFNSATIPLQKIRKPSHWSKLVLHTVFIFTNFNLAQNRFLVAIFGKIWLFTSFWVPTFVQFSFFTTFFEFPYSNFRLNLVFYAIFRLKIVFKLQFSVNFLWKFSTQNLVQFSIFTQNFSVTIFRKNDAKN